MKLTLNELMAKQSEVSRLCEIQGHVMSAWEPSGADIVSECKDCGRTAVITSEGKMHGIAPLTRCPNDDDHEPHSRLRQ